MTMARRFGVRAIAPFSFSARDPRRSTPISGKTPPLVDATTKTSPLSGLACNGELARAVPTLVFAGHVPAWKLASGHWLMSAAWFGARSAGSVTTARSSPASWIVCEIVVATSTPFVSEPDCLIAALNFGLNGSAAQLVVVKLD